ncbi:hypothetical protein MPTK1_6g02410 [Marchantia polymorpha subsp. ruderalis]|uniref:Uncharacterized protein n=2 Tax=Marchantia polymorpha TaxID=3197 RepID=A0AAF6BMQ8_MARPO|nr:hypothetical protein MARPO_0035s0026 [Marchantia polymorpha]BBN13292.1 hypothetical protein Mp_6g02410 [Marchantia polymorpha subsp. ruderalis]|eukprot:PTQ41218.1 hypothetical protein MARPO_0035s0026 [Marchantia polymorpha]
MHHLPIRSFKFRAKKGALIFGSKHRIDSCLIHWERHTFLLGQVLVVGVQSPRSFEAKHHQHRGVSSPGISEKVIEVCDISYLTTTLDKSSISSMNTKRPFLHNKVRLSLV